MCDILHICGSVCGMCVDGGFFSLLFCFFLLWSVGGGCLIGRRQCLCVTTSNYSAFVSVNCCVLPLSGG